MSGPIWMSWPVAGLMVILALCHAGWLVAARQRGRTGGMSSSSPRSRRPVTAADPKPSSGAAAFRLD